MTDRGFRIQSCDCGQILIDYKTVKDNVSSYDPKQVDLLRHLKEHEKYCPNCKEVVDVSE